MRRPTTLPLVALLALSCSGAQRPRARDPNEPVPVLSICLAGEAAARGNEYSGLAWHGDELFLLPQWSPRGLTRARSQPGFHPAVALPHPGRPAARLGRRPRPTSHHARAGRARLARPREQPRLPGLRGHRLRRRPRRPRCSARRPRPHVRASSSRPASTPRAASCSTATPSPSTSRCARTTTPTRRSPASTARGSRSSRSTGWTPPAPPPRCASIPAGGEPGRSPWSPSPTRATDATAVDAHAAPLLGDAVQLPRRGRHRRVRAHHPGAAGLASRRPSTATPRGLHPKRREAVGASRRRHGGARHRGG